MRGFEIDRVPLLEDVVVPSDGESEPAADDVEKLDALVNVDDGLLGRDRLKVRQVGVQLPLVRVEIEALEKVGDRLAVGAVGEAFPLRATNDAGRLALRLVAEEVVEAHAEHQRDPEKGRQRRIDVRPLDLREQRRRQPGVPPELDERHLLLQAKSPDLFSDLVAPQPFFQRVRQHFSPLSQVVFLR
jgi:hypothetical protein